MLEAVRATPPGEKLEPITLSEEYLKVAGHQARLWIIAAGLRLAVMLGAVQDAEFMVLEQTQIE